MKLHPEYITDADRVRICSHWLTRTINLTKEGFDPFVAPAAAAREMQMSESLLRGWTLRLMTQALHEGQVSARLNALKADVLATQPCAD